MVVLLLLHLTASGRTCVVEGEVEHVSGVCVCRFSPDGSSVAVGSDDACVDIYSVSGLVRTGYCRGIPSQVTHLDWSHDAAHLQVNYNIYHQHVCVVVFNNMPFSKGHFNLE